MTPSGAAGALLSLSKDPVRDASPVALLARKRWAFTKRQQG